MAMTADLTFLICNRVGLYSAIPVIRELQEGGVRVVIAGRESVRKLVAGELPDLAGSLLPLEPIVAQHRSLHYLHSLLIQTFTKLDFSRHYRDLRTNSVLASERMWRSTQFRIARYAPKWPSDQVNDRLSERLSKHLGNPFPTRRVVVFSQADVPHLLCARDQEVVTVMESWDHPFKTPAGYRSAMVLPWNRDLGSDWTQFQGDTNIVVGFPLKLRYALEAVVSDTENRRNGPVAMYAASTSSLDYPGYRKWFTDELVLIEDIARATAIAGWRLFIKPKPNGFEGEFGDITDRFPHVSVGTYGGQPRSAANVVNYYLDDRYNSARLSELGRCDLVINYGTTFALDAAAAERPVLQLDLRSSTRYPEVANALRRYHLERYFLGDSRLTLRVSDDRVVEQLGEYLSSVDARPIEMTKWLRAWLTSERCEDALKRMAHAISA